MKIYLSGAVSAAALLAAMSFAQAQTEPRPGSGTQSETNVQDEKRSGAERDGQKAQGEKRERAGQQQSQGADDAQKKDGKREGAARDSAEKPDAQKRDAAQTGEKRDDAQKRDATQTGEKRDDGQKRDAAQTGEKRDDGQKRDAAQSGDKREGGQKSAGGERSRTNVNINVTPQQKTRMRDVVRGGNIRKYSRSEVNFTLNVGTRIPETIVYYDPPPAIIEIIPDVRNYKVIVLDDVILVVDPETREIIDVIEI